MTLIHYCHRGLREINVTCRWQTVINTAFVYAACKVRVSPLPTVESVFLCAQCGGRHTRSSVPAHDWFTYACLCVCRTTFTEPALCRTVGIATVFAPGRGARVGGQRLHCEDGRGCHGGTLFCRNASIFLHSIIIIVADVIVTIAISGSGWAAQTERQKMAKWKNGDAGIQGVNMTCIISTFTDNWKHTARLLCLMKSLWLCHNIGAGSYKRKRSAADLLFLKNICEVNGVRTAMLQNQAWRKVRTRGTIPTFMSPVTPHRATAGHER